MAKKVNDRPWMDHTLPVKERVSLLLAEMTLEEKLQQLGGVWVFEILSADQTFSKTKAEKVVGLGIGQITRPAGATTLAPADVAQVGNEIQKYLIEKTRLGIPAMFHDEVCAGVLAQGATIFPQIIGLASTWQPELAAQMTEVIREQARALNVHHGLAPVLDIARDPRWGRIEETFGEDPYLVAQMGVSYIQGLQSKDWSQGVVGTGKHFVGYGLPEGGLNWAPAHIMQRELREVFLLPFEAAVREAGLGTIMPGYHELDGMPCSVNHWLLTDVLRGEWGFEGMVVSDYFAINKLVDYHGFASDKAAGARLTLDAGMDVEIPSIDSFRQPLLDAVQRGDLSVARIDESVERMLTYKFKFGIFEHPYVEAEAVASKLDTPAHRALARTIAEKSLVLLKNDGTLPLTAGDIKSIALVGPNADTARNYVGDYAYPAHIETLIEQASMPGIDTPSPEHMDALTEFTSTVTVMEALKEALPRRAKVTYARGCDVFDPSKEGFAAAVKAAKAADLVIAVMGDKAGLTLGCTVGEFSDRVTLGLPGVQEELVAALLDTGKPLVVVLVNGRPASIGWILERAAAVLEAWLPGEEGGHAIVDALLGKVNPGGKLPVTVVRSAGQVPLFYNHRPSGAKSFAHDNYVDESNTPLLPFGFGLSYTTFKIGNLKLDQKEVTADGRVLVSVDVTNTGDVAGDEVVQFYTRTDGASVTRPIKELRGFQRVTLKPGQKKTVTLTLNVAQMAYYDVDMRLGVEPGTVTVMVGSSSAEIAESAKFAINGPALRLRKRKVYFNKARVA